VLTYHLSPITYHLLRFMRLDKWLWSARFFKTRSLASSEIEAGHVELNGERAKPAKQVKLGDELRIRLNQYTYVVQVRGLSERRGPAVEAQRLYEETEASRAERARLAEQRRLAPTPAYEEGGRPTKRDRRDMSRVKRRY
jgi:ribosome-associated heat shock protein Hsp15